MGDIFILQLAIALVFLFILLNFLQLCKETQVSFSPAATFSTSVAF